MINLNQFRDWQAKDPDNRCVDIKISKYEGTKVWVYDRILGTGQFVKSVDEIDLDGLKEVEDRAKYERLRAKYEGGGA
jgi:hypothetical protein